MLAFVLGEVIAVLDYSIGIILLILSILLAIKIITKKQVSVFVMIFLSCLTGFLITENQISQRDDIYDMGDSFVTATGNVSKIQKNSYGYDIYINEVEISNKRFNQFLIQTKEADKIKIGNSICVKGTLEHFENERNPGNFDSQYYYMTLGIYGKIQADKIEIINSKYDIMRNNLQKIKLSLKGNLEQICGNSYKGIFSLCNNKSGSFSAILFGEKSELDEEIKSLYSESGIAHTLAISGLHISLIGMFLYHLLRKKFKFAFSACVAIAIVVCFSLMSGSGVATIRALIMFGLKLLGEVLGRVYDNLTAISTAGIMLMLWNPFVLFNSGFQMSFAAIAAIVIVWPRLQRILQINTEKRRNKIINNILFSTNISLVLNPIIAFNYYQLPTYSFAINIIVVPLMSVVMICGIVGTVASLISISLGRLIILPGCVVLEIYTVLCNLVAKLPFANIIVGQPKVITIIMYYLILIMFLLIVGKIRDKKVKEEKIREKMVPKSGRLMEGNSVKIARNKRINRKYIIATSILFFVLNSLLYIKPFSRGRLDITILDVGQGEGIVMHTVDGTNIMVDGGSSSVDNVGQYRIIPFLKSKRIRTIDYAIVTHADLDHTSGLVEMIKQSDNNGIKIYNIVMPDIKLKDENYMDLIYTAQQHNVKVLYITKNHEISLGDVKIKCIYPTATTSAQDRNDYSTVLSVTYGEFSMLLTGDISMEPEAEIINMLKCKYTVLKVAHHGSKYSTSSEFLDCVRPAYSVISVGENNMYGHPSGETLARLKEAGSIILRTDESGGITMSTDGKSIEIEKTIK